MSFATRCTACGTIFRVVQDQLRVSEGWVRCGRCAEVFDAREQLFDIDLDTPPVWSGDSTDAPSAPLQSPRLEAEQGTGFKIPAVEVDHSPQSVAPPPAMVGLAAIADPHARQEPQWGSAAAVSEDSWGVDSAEAPRFGPPDVEAAIISPLPSEPPTESLPASTDAVSAEAAELPSFMRPASADSRWQRPGVRITMAGLSLLLLIALVLQLLLHFRDAITAISPQSLPSMQSLCHISGCQIQPWRRIEALSVENSALTQTNSASTSGGNTPDNRYLLTLSVHNKSNLPAATPHIELSLLDPSGLVTLRRVLSPGDLLPGGDSGIAPVVIGPRADFPMQLQLTTGAQRINGYSVEIFYP